MARLAAAIVGLAFAVAGSTGPAAAQQRELGAHEHGKGTLNIALEGSRLTMELEAPGVDIVGFEHKAKSAKDKAVVANAKKQLAKPLALFKLPAAAGCVVKQAKANQQARPSVGGPAGNEEDARAQDGTGGPRSRDRAAGRVGDGPAARARRARARTRHAQHRARGRAADDGARGARRRHRRLRAHGQVDARTRRPSSQRQEAAGQAAGTVQAAGAAGCVVKQATAKLEGEDDHGHAHGHSHGKAKDGKQPAGKAEKDDHDHSQFHAEYALDCKSPGGITAIEFDYFGAFAGAQKLEVNVITPKGQSKFEVTRAKPRLDLGGMM